MTGTYWGKGTIGLQAAEPKRSHTRPLTFGLIINVDKTKVMVHNRRLGKGETLTVEDHKIEVARRFKYLGKVINDSNDEMEEI